MTDIIARLDALAAANAVAEYRFVDGQYIAFTSALHDAWPEIRARLKKGYSDGLADAIRLIDAEWYDQHSTQRHDGELLCADLRSRLNDKLVAYEAACAKETT